MKVVVLGAGAFGTALAVSFAHKLDVHLIARSATRAEEMRSQRKNARYLPDAVLPDQLSIGHELPASDEDTIFLLAVPTQTLGKVLQENAQIFYSANLIACCKGVDQKTGRGPVSLISDKLPNSLPAMMTGPSFAGDIAVGLPTALTLACADPARGKWLQHALVAPNLRLYRTTDTIGAELGGALKNVIAIAAGIAIGAGLGDSARAAVITRGFAEMRRFAVAQGARDETLVGLSGLGDLILTCTSQQSRNFRFGQALGKEQPFDPTITVEGAATARALQNFADEMPITQAVMDIMDGDTNIKSVMKSLLERPLKEE